MRFRQRLVLSYIREKYKLLSWFSKRLAAASAFQLFCTPQYRNRKKLPRIFEQAEVLRFSFYQYNIQGYRWNEAAEKKILILHGFESSVINFDRYIKPLVKKGYCVLAVDAPAHGRSSGRTVNVLLYKEFIETIIHKYGPITNFMAHSLGGLALSLALEELSHDESYKAVFIAPATETVTAINSLFQFLQLDEKVRKEFDAIIEEKSGHSPEWFSIKRAAKNIKATVLWLHDKNDTMTPLTDVKPLIDKAYPNFTFHITEGLGHRRIYRDNKVMKVVIDFF
ncbi:MAG: alpha/beta hydrolase [Flavisolibacter sp.]|nr:alpha/beta hydrolase [Flavisolibacter sp.]